MSDATNKSATEASSPDGPRVKDKVVIVTGTNSIKGIGRATAHQYARGGARALYLCDRDDDNLPALKAELGSLYRGTELHTRRFDAADEAGVKEVVDHAVATYGRLDVFFANAGTSGSVVPFWDITVEEFEAVMKVNVVSVWLAGKHAAPAMKKTSASKPAGGGSIVATASVAGLRSNAGGTAYSASKAAVINMATTMACQLVGTNVRVNAICPGLIETGMTAATYEYARKRKSEAKIGQLNPLRRGGTADEIARVALFLGSDESSYVNGQSWVVDGGLSAGLPFIPGKLS